MKQGGTTANETGKILENFINDTLLRRGYEFVNKNKFEIARSLNQKIYTTQMILCDTIYNTKWNVDFVLHNPTEPPLSLIIECKWQQAAGSVDEK